MKTPPNTSLKKQIPSSSITMMRILICSCILVLVVSQSSEAALIVAPISATTTMGTRPGFGTPVPALTDQVDLTIGYTSDVTDFDVYAAANPTMNPNGSISNLWGSNYITTGHLDFDMGSDRTITRVAMWTFGTGGGIALMKDFTVYTSPDSSFGSSTNVGAFTLGTSPNTMQVFDVTDSTNRFIRIEIASNWGSNYTAFGEFAVAVVPEPSSAALLGLGGLALMLRRRR